MSIPWCIFFRHCVYCTYFQTSLQPLYFYFIVTLSHDQAKFFCLVSSLMSKRPNSDQPTTAKRARKASGFRLARHGLSDPVQSTSSGSSRFITLSAGKGGTLRAQNRIFHRSPEPSSPSKNQSNDAEPLVSDTTSLQEAAQYEDLEVQLDSTSHAEHTQEKKKRTRHTKTYVSDLSMFKSS
jgi:hypothetical protein